MTDAPSGAKRAFALLLALWLVLMIGAASPAWADQDDGGHGSSHDDDDDDNEDDQDDEDEVVVTTTSIAPTPTTTAPSSPPTTTPVATTSTTVTTTTTTPPVAPDPHWKEQLETWTGSTTTTTSNHSEFESKESLVLAMGHSGGEDDGDDGTDTRSGDGGFHILPREGLTVAYRAAVETIESQLLLASMLGILIGALMLIGVDKRQLV